jgi:hypothetical protein
MSDLPERIWTERPDIFPDMGIYYTYHTDGQGEYIRADTVQAQIDAAVKAERERMKPFVDTAQRFHRRVQLLKGFWASKLARTRKEERFWRAKACRPRRPDDAWRAEVFNMAFASGVNAACDAMREDGSLYKYYGELVENVRAALNPRKEVMPSEARTRAAHDTAPAGLSAGGGAPPPWPKGLIHLTNTRDMRCATKGCEGRVSTRFEGGGIGSDYCEPCGLKVAKVATRGGA